MIIQDIDSKDFVNVVSGTHLLLVGLDGFTIKDLAERFPGERIAIHVQDESGDWVPVKLAEFKG